MLLIKKEFEVMILDIKQWWIFIRLSLNSTSFLVGVIYIPPYQDRVKYIEVIDLLSAAVGSVLERFGDEPLFLGADFNGRIGQLNDEISEELIQGSVMYSDRVVSDKVIEKEGCVLLEMMSENGMFLMNGRTPGDCPGE